MIKYTYTGKTKEGEIVHGIKEASDKTGVYRELQKEGVTIISVEEKKQGLLGGSISMILKRVSMHEKIVFSRNLAVMLNAGLPLSRAITILSRQTKNAYLKKIYESLEEELRKGKSFHEALATFPKVFSSLFISMVAAGEESGKLSESLEVVGGQMEKSYLLAKKVKGAMVYPGIIIFAMSVIAIFMLTFVVPTLTGTFKELNVDLPATTRFIIFVSDTLKNHLMLVILGVIALGVGVFFAGKTGQGSRFLYAISLKIPVIGGLIKEVYAARTARTLSSLLTSGVSVLDSIRITSDVLQNPFYKEVLSEATKKVQVGEPMSGVFTNAEKYYPIYVGEMMAVGEETGEIGNMLQKVAGFFESEVEQKTKDMSTIIEPFLMLIVGAAVGFFALSMIAPMYSLVNVI